MKRFITFLLIGILAVNCKSPIEVPLTNEEQLAIDVVLIDKYLAERGIVAQVHSSGLRYVIHKEGVGIKPNSKHCIKSAYSGTLMEGGEVFDSSTSHKYQMVGFILGWQFGFRQLSVGSEATFYIPSSLAYGPVGNKIGEVVIPANANLIFEVTLLEITTYDAAGNYCN